MSIFNFFGNKKAKKQNIAAVNKKNKTEKDPFVEYFGFDEGGDMLEKEYPEDGRIALCYRLYRFAGNMGKAYVTVKIDENFTKSYEDFEKLPKVENEDVIALNKTVAKLLDASRDYAQDLKKNYIPLYYAKTVDYTFQLWRKDTEYLSKNLTEVLDTFYNIKSLNEISRDYELDQSSEYEENPNFKEDVTAFIAEQLENLYHDLYLGFKIDNMMEAAGKKDPDFNALAYAFTRSASEMYMKYDVSLTGLLEFVDRGIMPKCYGNYVRSEMQYLKKHGKPTDQELLERRMARFKEYEDLNDERYMLCLDSMNRRMAEIKAAL